MVTVGAILRYTYNKPLRDHPPENFLNLGNFLHLQTDENKEHNFSYTKLLVMTILFIAIHHY